MQKGVVVEGDPLTRGGIAVKGSGCNLSGFRAALLGDPVKCALHGEGTIIEGNPNTIMNNKPVALDGHQVSCGCKLIAARLSGKTFVEKVSENIKNKIDEANNFLDDKIFNPISKELDENFSKNLKSKVCGFDKFLDDFNNLIDKFDKKEKIKFKINKGTDKQRYGRS